MSLESPNLVDRVLYPRLYKLPGVVTFNDWSKRQRRLFICSRMSYFNLLPELSTDRQLLRFRIAEIADVYSAFLKVAAYRRKRSGADINSRDYAISRHATDALRSIYEQSILKGSSYSSVEEIIFDVNAKHGVYGFRTMEEPGPDNTVQNMVVMEETAFKQYCAMAYKEGQKYFGQCATGECVDTLDPISFFEPLYKDDQGMQSTEHLTSKILAKMGLHKMPFGEFMSVLEINLQRGREGKAGPLYSSNKKAE